MLKKTVTYTDFDGTERTEDFYFHLTEAEIANMEMENDGGLAERLRRIVNSKDIKKIKEYFENIILSAYGEKSEDGRRFVKSEEITNNFKSTQAYSDIWMELVTNEDAASEFVNGIIPKSILDRSKKQNADLLKLTNDQES